MQERKSADVAAFVFHSLNTAKLQRGGTMGFRVAHPGAYLVRDTLFVVKAELSLQLLFRFRRIADPHTRSQRFSRTVENQADGAYKALPTRGFIPKLFSPFGRETVEL